MNSSAREKIFKSWTGISEVALIKEVATKGEHIELCIEFWARKRKMPIADYRLFFHDVVQTYVQRLLTERLVCKAENVLRNVQRDVRCCYYQFACECDDDGLREMVLEYLSKKDVHNIGIATGGGAAATSVACSFDDMQELRHNWELLQQLQTQPALLAKCKAHMPQRRLNLEAMLSMDASFRKRLLVELYFANGDVTLLPYLNKHAVWDYLVETQQCEEIVRWCTIGKMSKASDGSVSVSALEQRYALWLPVEMEMYEYALKTLHKPDEVLRDCFAEAGYFFSDERTTTIHVLRRICSTRSFRVNKDLLEKLPIARLLLEREQYMLLLRSFVSVRELEELATESPEHSKLLELIVTLRTHDLQTRIGLEKISYATKLYLESCEQQRDINTANHASEEPLVAFYEFLCHEPTIASLNCFLRSSVLQRIPYLLALSDRLVMGDSAIGAQSSVSDPQSVAHKNTPTPYDLLRKFKHIDFKNLSRRESPHEIACFSNERLCQRYARKYQLNFLHYLKQQRSAYAVYYLLTTHLQNYAQLTRQQLFNACETVTELALQHSNSDELVSHCIAFGEMLGFDTQSLRTLLKLTRLLETHKNDKESVVCVSNYGVLISQVEAHLLAQLRFGDDDVDIANTGTFPLAEYQALMRLVVNCNQQRQWPSKILQRYAAADDWWHLLVLFQHFEIPLNEVRQLIAHFKTRQIGEHLLRALSYEAPPLSTYERSSSNGSGSANGSKRHNNISMRQRKANGETMPTMTTSHETVMTSSLSSCNDTSGTGNALTSLKMVDPSQQLHFLAIMNQAMSLGQTTANSLDVFAIILLSATAATEEPIDSVSKFLEIMQDNETTQHATSCNLLRSCVKHEMPVLAMLAATINIVNIDWHWFVWLAVSTKQWNDLLPLAVQDKMKASSLSWRVIETAVRQGNVATVYRSACIFYGQQQQNALVQLFRFLLLTQTDAECGDEAVHALSLYLLACSNDEVHLPLSRDDESTKGARNSRREQLLSHTIQLFLVHLQHNFDSIFKQQKFLACICRSGMTDLCGGQLDFCLLKEIFAILQTTTLNQHQTQQNFGLNFERLLQQQRDNPEEYKRLLSALLEARAYDSAVRLATLLHLPICDIVHAKWIASLRTTNQNGSASDDDDPDADITDFGAYEAEVVEHSLPPEVLVNFFLYAASQLDDGSAARRKYILLRHALNVIKKHLLFPNESFDRDQIEYTMIVCYLQLDETVAVDLDIYHSEYYEQIMLKERCVLYKSFLELKELAGIEDLNPASMRMPLSDVMQQRLEALLHRLLDEGDIIEALRLQELFDCRPLDLRFIVFCMALAEGVTTIFSMSSEERQLLRDFEKSSFAKFNKRTLDTLRDSSSQSNPPYSSSPLRDEFSDSCSTLEFEEIPSKEKRETLETIHGIASKLKHGVDLGKRIVMAYRAAMYLDKEYLDVLRTKDTAILLRSVAEEGCLHRLLVVSDILTSTHMTAEEIADLLAYEITTAIIRPRFYIFNAVQKTKVSFKNADLWGYNIDRDLHLFLELTPNTTKLGNCLLEYCDALKAYRKYQDNKPYEHNAVFEKLAELISVYGLPPAGAAAASAVNSSSDVGIVSKNSTTVTTAMPTINTIGTMQPMNPIVGAGASTSNGIGSLHPPQVLSHKKQNLIYVELLIKAHQCFVHECSMEGIANILNRAKALNAVLTQAKSWSLIVRMLIGIARYREMFYCFDSLIENEQFESLLGQFDEDKTIGLRQAILAYLREYEPHNSRELLKLAALHFLMYKDLAEMWEQDAQAILAKALDLGGGNNAETRLRSTPELIMLLQQALQNYTHATENYLLDNKLLLAQKSAAMAEVIAMQIDLASTACQRLEFSICVLNVQTRDEFQKLVNLELKVPQALILSRGYGYEINWKEALLSQYVYFGRETYLRDFLAVMSITDGLIENIIKGFLRNLQVDQETLPQTQERLAYLVSLVRSVTLKYKLASLLSLKTYVISAISDHTVHYLKDTNYGRNENHNMPEI